MKLLKLSLKRCVLKGQKQMSHDCSVEIKVSLGFTDGFVCSLYYLSVLVVMFALRYVLEKYIKI